MTRVVAYNKNFDIINDMSVSDDAVKKLVNMMEKEPGVVRVHVYRDGATWSMMSLSKDENEREKRFELADNLEDLWMAADRLATGFHRNGDEEFGRAVGEVATKLLSLNAKVKVAQGSKDELTSDELYWLEQG
jgi:hypothetical protein